MAISINAISGPYSGQWSAEFLGVTEDGYELEHTFYSEPIRGDNLGDSIQDEVHRGADVYVNFTCMEFGAAALVNNAAVATSSPFWPTGISAFNAVGANATIGVIGDSRGEYSDSLVLTAIAGTPAAANPATITFPQAILAANFPIRTLYASRVRRIPMRMICYPFAGGAGSAQQYVDSIYYYTTT